MIIHLVHNSVLPPPHLRRRLFSLPLIRSSARRPDPSHGVREIFSTFPLGRFLFTRFKTGSSGCPLGHDAYSPRGFFYLRRIRQIFKQRVVIEKSSPPDQNVGNLAIREQGTNQVKRHRRSGVFAFHFRESFSGKSHAYWHICPPFHVSCLLDICCATIILQRALPLHGGIFLRPSVARAFRSVPHSHI